MQIVCMFRHVPTCMDAGQQSMAKLTHDMIGANDNMQDGHLALLADTGQLPLP